MIYFNNETRQFSFIPNKKKSNFDTNNVIVVIYKSTRKIWDDADDKKINYYIEILLEDQSYSRWSKQDRLDQSFDYDTKELIKSTIDKYNKTNPDGEVISIKHIYSRYLPKLKPKKIKTKFSIKYLKPVKISKSDSRLQKIGQEALGKLKNEYSWTRPRVSISTLGDFIKNFS